MATPKGRSQAARGSVWWFEIRFVAPQEYFHLNTDPEKWISNFDSPHKKKVEFERKLIFNLIKSASHTHKIHLKNLFFFYPTWNFEDFYVLGPRTTLSCVHRQAPTYNGKCRINTSVEFRDSGGVDGGSDWFELAPLQVDDTWHE